MQPLPRCKHKKGLVCKKLGAKCLEERFFGGVERGACGFGKYKTGAPKPPGRE